MRRETRSTATLLASAAAAIWLFSARTWLPDLEVAYAAANVTLTLLAGLGLTWLAAQPIRGAKTAAVIAALVIGINGAFAPERFGLRAADGPVAGVRRIGVSFNQRRRLDQRTPRD